MDKDTKQKLEGRIEGLKQSLADIDQKIDQAMDQCPYIANLRNMRLSLQGGLFELEQQLNSHKDKKVEEKKEGK